MGFGSRRWRIVVTGVALLAPSACGAAPPEGGVRSIADVRLSSGEPGHSETMLRAPGAQLYVQGWRPRGKARATVVIVHGLRDHGGRYAALGRELAKHGWAVYAPDLRGHGRSTGRRVAIDSFDRYVADTKIVIGEVRGWEPGAPLFVMGHSMGGAIAALLAERKDADIDGLVLSAPALKSFTSVVEACGANLLADLDPNSPQLSIDMAKWSRDPRVVADNRSDPLVYQKAGPVSTGAMLLEASAIALEEAPRVRIPVIAFHGAADGITDPEGSKQFVERVRSADKTLKIYPKLYHDLWNEPERAAVVADLVQWLRDHDAEPEESESDDAAEDDEETPAASQLPAASPDD